MDQGRFRSIMTWLGCYELTVSEQRFIDSLKRHFRERGGLFDQQELMLEGIYREKRRWAENGLMIKRAP